MPLSAKIRRERRAYNASLLQQTNPDEPPKPTSKQCKNCPKRFKPNPSRKKHDFCSDACRKEFNRYGGSYRKLLDKLQTEIPKQVREALDQDKELFAQTIQRFRLEADDLLKQIRELKAESLRYARKLRTGLKATGQREAVRAAPRPRPSQR